MKKLYAACNRKWMPRAALLVLAGLFAWTAGVQAQTLQVSGLVTGAQGGGEVGVTIVVKENPATGTTTDSKGYYSIKVPSADATLIFSYLGYKTVEIPVSGRTRIDVQMQEDATEVDEVVVVGYGTQKKQFVIGSVSQVTSKDIMKAPGTNLQSMLTGRLAGMTSIQGSGAPGGDASTLLVRGFSTFNDSSPLCIVDGVERPFNNLNPNDIASVSVLKDAATAAIYGVRGANGVILVTTKSGSQGFASITYDGSVTFTQNTAMPKMLNAEDYIYWHNKARELDNLAPYWTPENLARMEQMGILGDTDWLSKIYKKFGLTHQHNISVSGGTDKVKYYSSVGLMNQDGILRNTDFKRYNMRGNVDAKITRNLTFAINMSVAHTERNWPGLSISPQSEFSPVTQAFYALPLLKETYEGKPLGYTNGSYTYTPLAALEDAGYQNQRTWTFDSTARLEYDFGSIKALQGLKASIFMGYNVGSTLDYNYLRKYSLYKFDPKSFTVTETIAQGIPESNFNKSNSLGWSMTIRPQINYEREFGKHSVSALFFFERRKSYDDTMTGYKTGYYADFPIDLSMGLVNQSPYTTGSHSYTGSAGFAGRISYAYDKKYLLEVTMRADGSYKFAPKNRWGYFPSVAVGWVMSEEAFFKRALPKIEYFKLRASYGVLGSDDTSPYLYMQSFFSTAPGFTCVIGGQPQSAYYTGGYIHDNLTWSRTHTYNFGMELRAFQGKLGIEFDWFYKLTSRILESDSGGTYAPSLGGNNPAWLNSGRVDNRGFELTLRHANSFRNGWSYALTGNLSWARNRVLSRRIADNHPSYRAILGEPLGSIYGFQALGLFQTQEQVDNYPTAPSGWAGLGEIMYKDIDGDGKIDRDHDYVKIGRSTTPEMSFSLNMDVAWKNISLSVLWQGVALCDYQLSGLYGNGHTDNTMYTRPFYGDGNAAYYLVENSWRPDHTNAEYPRLHAITNSNNANASTWWIRNGAYLRLKDVRLSYALPKKLLSKIGIERTSIYVAGTNLLTFSAFKYIDPENPGINNGYYPQQRTYSIGLNLTF